MTDDLVRGRVDLVRGRVDLVRGRVDRRPGLGVGSVVRVRRIRIQDPG